MRTHRFSKIGIALRAVEEASWYLAVMAMSAERAKEILGFRASDQPDAAEIKKAWQRKAMEHHPDRGGDPEKMKEANVARDVLEGSRLPDKTFSGPGSSSPAPSRPSAPSTSYAPPKKQVITLEDALRPLAGSLAGVEWLFVTVGQRGDRGWTSDESSASESSYVLVGRHPTGDLLAVGLMHSERSYYYVGGGGGRDTWAARTSRLGGSRAKAPSALASLVAAALKDVGFGGRFNHKVMDVQGKSDLAGALAILNKGAVRGEAMSLKHWLVQGGQVAGDDPSVASRKHTVEVRVKETGNTESHRMLVVVVDGKPEEVSEEDMVKVRKVRFLRFVFGDYYYNGSHKMLTRSKTIGVKAMAWMAKHLDSLSPESRAVLRTLGGVVEGADP